MIEKGRYSSPKIPPEDRICVNCKLHEVEDEFHFIMRCSLYNSLRDNMFEQFNDAFDFQVLTDLEKFHLIMSANDYETVHAVANYTKAAFDKRSNVAK